MAGSLLVRDYLLLGLRIGRLRGGTVATYTGDPALRRYVDGGPCPEPGALARTARRLREALPDAGLPPVRTRFLDAQLRALDCAARRLAGRPVDYVEELRASYGVRVVPGDEDRYRAAHRLLDGLLAGPGSLAARLAAYRRRETVPADRLGPAVAGLAAALRERTREVVELPADEQITVELVTDRPWSGLTRHDGPLRSTVHVEVGTPLRGARLAALVAHEAYPGHHTEHCLVRGRPDPLPEQQLVLCRTPQALLAEGAAEVGLDVVVGPGWGSWVAAALAEAGVRCDGELAEAVETALRDLAPVRQDAALLLHDRGGRVDDALAHLRRWLLVGEPRARRMLRFLTDPAWSTQTTTYVEGAALLRAWLARPGMSPAERFRRLHREPLVPADLAV